MDRRRGWQRAEQEVDQQEEPGENSAGTAGPHAKPSLTNEAATPGTGMLPDPDSDDPDQQPSG